MSLEFLANETLLEIFEFFHAVDLFRAFHDLNSRFDILLFAHFRPFHLDFRSVSKNDFDLVCREHLPSIVDRIISLHLSDDDETPQQNDLFLSHGFTFHQFIHLRSLSLHHICSKNILHLVANQCDLLQYLTHLKITGWHFERDETSFEYFVSALCRLPKLTHCHFGILLNFYYIFPVPTVISSTLECLSIEGAIVRMSQLAILFWQTPRLRRLDACLDDEYDDQELQSTISSLTVLKVIIKDSLQTFMNFLQNMPNLCHLTIETKIIQPNGHRWQQIIIDYLPQLKVFRLKMEFNIPGNREQAVDELLHSFRSRFWMEERRWFVQCHWYPQNISTHMCLYTLPYAFRVFVHGPGILSRSTCPNNNDYWSYHRVHSLYIRPSLSQKLVRSAFRFSNIQHLCLTLPFDDHFWSIVPKFKKLISLRICAYGYAESQLQALVSRAPHLSTLIYDSSPSLVPQELLLMNVNLIVRRVDLQEYDHWFDEQLCAQLIRSPLGTHCEVLRIKVKSRTSILDFVKTMLRLRALNVQCHDDVYKEAMDPIFCSDDSDYRFSSTQDELVDWLRSRLSTAVLVKRDTHHLRDIRLWLR